MLADSGKYRKKSKELPLQVLGGKCIFHVTITLSENVIESLSNSTPKKVILSKYFIHQKFVINYLSKYMSITSKISKLETQTLNILRS